MSYALFKDGKQVSKAHSTKEAVAIEAHELGVVYDARYWRGLAEGYEIKPVTDSNDEAGK